MLIMNAQNVCPALPYLRSYGCLNNVCYTDNECALR